MNYVPLYLNLEKTVATETCFLSSTHVLYDIIPDIQINGSLYYNLGATAILCNTVYFKKLNATALYIGNDTVLTGLTGPHLARISRIQYGPDLFPFGAINSNNILEYVFKCTTMSISYKPNRQFNTLKQVYDGVLELPIQKVSAKHIRHIQIRDLRCIEYDELLTKLGNSAILIEQLIKVGAHESFICGLITWILLLPKTERDLWNKSYYIHQHYESSHDFFKKIKECLTLKLKALQNVLHMDLSCFFELEVLVNRGMGDIDWETERLHRERPNVTHLRFEDIKTCALDLFMRLRKNGARPKIYQWQDFWAQRWQWAPTGAFTSQYEEDDQYRHEQYDMRHKFYGFCAMPEVPFNYFYDRRRETMAKASIKYEWGKQRAIYGVDNTNFVLSSFGMAGAEEVLSTMFPIGAEAQSGRVKRKVEQVLENGIPYCFDFEDFNSQHDNNSMKVILVAYVTVFSDKLSEQQVQSIQWLIDAIDNTYVRETNGNIYRTTGTLLSGWRLTTFMNTVLNYIYTRIMMGQHVFPTTHNGDDILGAVTTMNEVRNLEAQAVKYNVRFQVSKCYLGSIAEFLRVDHRNGSGSQYLARAVSTFVHGPTEMAVPNDPMSVLNSILTRADEIKERKGDLDILDKLVKQQLKVVCKIWELDKRVIDYYPITHRINGGYSTTCCDEALKLKFHRTRIRSYESTQQNKVVYNEKVLPGVYSYALNIVRKYGLDNYFKRILNTASLAVYSRSIKYKFGVQVTEHAANSVDRLHASQYRMFSDKFSGIKVTIAKSFGVPISSVRAEGSYISSLLDWCNDPLLALSLWT